jgi:hypothetical protein
VTAGLGEFCKHEEKYIKGRGALQQILPTQIANNIATTEKSENHLQVLDFIEVEQSKTEFGVELGCTGASAQRTEGQQTDQKRANEPFVVVKK